MAKDIINKKYNIVDTPQEAITWNDDAERLILYADIMGFSHRVTQSNHNELIEDLL